MVDYHYKQTLFCIHDKIVAYINSKQLGQHAQDLHKLKLDKISGWKEGSEHRILPLSVKLLTCDSCWEKERQLWHGMSSCLGMTLCRLTPSREGPTSKNSQTTQTGHDKERKIKGREKGNLKVWWVGHWGRRIDMGGVGVDYMIKMYYKKLIEENTHTIFQGNL